MTVPPGASACAKSGASSISGPARMLAISRSNGARAREHRRVHAVGDREQQLARAVAELHVVDRGIVARHVDGDGIDVGGDAARLRPQRQRGKGEQAGAGADVGNVCEARNRFAASKSSASRQPAVVACWPVPKARPASISKLIASAAGRVRRRVDEEAAGADRLQARLAHRHPVGFGEAFDLRLAGAETAQRRRVRLPSGSWSK